MRNWLVNVGVGCLVALGACGEQAVDGNYGGEALFSFGGTVRLEASALESDATGELRVAVFWARANGAGGSLFSAVGAVEQSVDAATSFPARFTLTLRRPPDAALIGRSPDVQGAYALAMVLVYLDQNGDVRWDRGSEPLVGAAADAFLLYAPDGLSSGRFGTLGKGFHLLASVNGAQCTGGATLLADPSALQITVSGSYPEAALLDLDCDGSSEEWSGTCPPLASIHASCRDQDGDGIIDTTAAGAEICATCDYLLWDEGADDVDCDAWRDGCEGLTDDDECERAARQCHDDHRGSDHPEDDPPPER